MSSSHDVPLWQALPSSSFLEYAFLRWVLAPAVLPEIVRRVVPQAEVVVYGRHYRVDYELEGESHMLAMELDGFEFHGARYAFTYDRTLLCASTPIESIATSQPSLRGSQADGPLSGQRKTADELLSGQTGEPGERRQVGT
jgi:hypothetical protein